VREVTALRQIYALLAAVLICAACAAYSWADENWTSYTNGRFGYSVEHPDIFANAKTPDNGDGVQLESDDEEYGLIISGGYNVLEEDAEKRLAGRLESASHIVEGSSNFGDGWYKVVYSDDGGEDGVEHLFHEYGVINGDAWATFILGYPKGEEKRFAPIITRMEKSLALPPYAESGESGGPDVGAFSLKNGRVFKNDKELDCEVYKMSEAMSEGFDNGIAYWAAFGPDASDAVTEKETGVWFFGSEGDFMTFIPLESEHEYQDIQWSPTGDRLILVRGSGMRSDVFFELYAEGLEKRAEFPGMRGQIQWLGDGMRFAFTRIDDTRDTGDGVFSAYALKLSAVLYDSAAGETIVLKEATDKQNFRFGGISDDGEKIVITEESVKSPKDWGRKGLEEGKITEREITVPVPAAG
jgi:hypothetical protein